MNTQQPYPLILALFLTLPLTLPLTLLTAACTEPRSFTAVPAGATVLAFGDSITFGTGAGKGEGYPARLADATGWQVINAGIPGETSNEALARVDTLLDTHSPALVILELGGNDFLRRRPQSAIKADLDSLIRNISARDIPLVLVAVPELSLLRASIGRLSDAPLYAELADEHMLLLVPELLAEVLSEESLRADPVHPNARGYAVFSEGLVKALQEAGYYAK